MSAPDRLIVRGTVHTQDAAQPLAEAFGVIDGCIVGVGTIEQVTAVVGSGAEILEHSKGAVLPGLLDAHNHHAVAGAEDLFELSFPPTLDVDGIIAAVSDWAAVVPEGEWVVGGLWGSGLVEELSGPGPLERLDAAAGDRPVLLADDSHHNKWANTAALRFAGLLEAEDPPGGKIVRDLGGRPTGLLFEAAGAIAELARRATVTPEAEYHARCSERGAEMLASYGVTGFQDAAASIDTIRALKRLDDEGRLKAWVVTSLLINDNIFGNEQIGDDLLPVGAGYRTEHHRPTWSKIFLDGVPPTRTGAFLQPYLPDEEHGDCHVGSTTMPIEELVSWLGKADDLGIGVKVHCTGDASVRMVLDAVQQVREEGRTVPVQIAHGQYVHVDDVPRFAALGVVAEISPYLWFPGVIPAALHACLPSEVADHLQPNRALLDAGAAVVVGSDWPVSESPNPWYAVSGLVTRQDPTGRFPGSLWPEQAITREEAIRCVTSAAADAMGVGDVTGRIRVGNSADFVLLDRDPYEVPLDELGGTAVLETWFAGERVFSRDETEGIKAD